MKYLLLCQYDTADLANVPAAAEAQIMQAMMGYNQQLMQAGVLLAAGQLREPQAAQHVYASEGRIRTQDGSGLKGDTQIGGYYLIDVPGEPEATGWAAKCPVAQMGAVQVREVAFAPL